MNRALFATWAGLLAIVWFAVSSGLLVLVVTGRLGDPDVLYGFWPSLLLCVLVVGVSLLLAILGLKRGHVVSRCCAAILIAYLTAYAILSVRGRYEPSVVGLNGVKSYSWAPYGFYDPDHPWKGSFSARRHPEEKTGGWNTCLEAAFAPLVYFDVHCFHNKGVY